MKSSYWISPPKTNNTLTRSILWCIAKVIHKESFSFVRAEHTEQLIKGTKNLEENPSQQKVNNKTLICYKGNKITAPLISGVTFHFFIALLPTAIFLSFSLSFFLSFFEYLFVLSFLECFKSFCIVLLSFGFYFFVNRIFLWEH